MKALTNPSSNPLQRASLVPAVSLKDVPKAGYECTLEKNQPMTVKERRNINLKFDAAFETIFRISDCFQRSKQNLNIYFSLEQG